MQNTITGDSPKFELFDLYANRGAMVYFLLTAQIWRGNLDFGKNMQKIT